MEKKLALLEDTIQKYFWKDVEEEQLEDGLYRGAASFAGGTRTASIIQMMSWLRYSSRQKAYIMESAPIFRMEIPGMCRSAA